jgi:hypothetical protein
MLKCVNLIEIQFYAYLYGSSFLVLRYIIFETTAQILEIELGGQCGYMGAYLPMDICPVANTHHWLLAIIEHAKTNISQQNMW